MTDSMDNSGSSDEFQKSGRAVEEDDAGSVRQRVLERQSWLAFVLPMIVFGAVGTLEVTDLGETTLFGMVGYDDYPIVYTIKILLTTLTLLFVWPSYRSFPPKVSPLAFGVGVTGVVVWVGLTKLGFEQRLPLAWLTGSGDRVAYNPFEAFADWPRMAYAFLAVRFFGLAVVIAIVEEMFLRGFLIRYVEDAEHWNKLPIGQAGRAALLAGTVFPMLTHPGELLAAMVWFSMVSWLMVRTRSIWDCIVAHMITNLLLGVYVVSFEQWQLW